MESLYIKLLRPRHWVKNLFLFSAPFFGGTLFTREALPVYVSAFAAFSLCASAAYILNDICDFENDRSHPEKKCRPLASGLISRTQAWVLFFLIAASSLALSSRVSLLFATYVIAYLLIQALYSFYLKGVAIADIFCIASGFIIRVFAGGEAFQVTVSKWLFITMFMLSLMLAAGKRLSELDTLQENASDHRKSLANYTSATLNNILVISSSSSLIAYSLYTLEQLRPLIYTIPVVTFGLFRYIMLSRQGAGDPTEALTGDRWLGMTVVAWLLIVALMRYSYV